jgi:S1-C subfamily serine protease
MLSHLAVAVLALAVGIGATVALYSPGSSSSPGQSGVSLPGSNAVPQPGASSPSGGSSGTPSEQSVINKVEPGTVIITSSLQYNGEAGFATGMIINSDGLVLTNNHVIEDSTKMSAEVVGTGKTYPATVIGYDKTGDIALIKLQGASGLHTIPIGNSSTVKSGDAVVGLGNAQGQGSLVPVTGQITGVNQTITASDAGATISSETLHGMLETNANIVQGDSGGPLANASGQVIGMDTAGDSVNMGTEAPSSGFAIPINTALAVAREIAAGHATSAITIGYPPFIGVFIASGTNSNPQQQAEQQQQGENNQNPFGGGAPGGGFGGTPSCYTSNANLQIPTTVAPVSSGTLVDGVICGSPAQTAGLTGGAVITAVNGQAAGSPSNLGTILAKLKPGDTANITWVSPSGKTTTSTMHLVAGPPQ